MVWMGVDVVEKARHGFPECAHAPVLIVAAEVLAVVAAVVVGAVVGRALVADVLAVERLAISVDALQALDSSYGLSGC